MSTEPRMKKSQVAPQSSCSLCSCEAQLHRGLPPQCIQTKPLRSYNLFYFPVHCLNKTKRQSQIQITDFQSLMLQSCKVKNESSLLPGRTDSLILPRGFEHPLSHPEGIKQQKINFCLKSDMLQV